MDAGSELRLSVHEIRIEKEGGEGKLWQVEESRSDLQAHGPWAFSQLSPMAGKR
jgi:hypothetical protein